MISILKMCITICTIMDSMVVVNFVKMKKQICLKWKHFVDTYLHLIVFLMYLNVVGYFLHSLLKIQLI
jgi:hypothetical protein